MKKVLHCVLFLAAVFMMATTANAQEGSRAYIKRYINQWGECRNVCITKTGGDIALHGRNGYAYKNIPTALANKIQELHDDDEYIDDIQLTEDESWLILYGANDAVWHNIPSALERKIREYHNNGEIINTITFNDRGEWIIITDDRYAASSSSLIDWLSDGEDSHGELWTAQLTDDALIAVYDRGYKYRGNVPDDLRQKARTVSFDVYRLKMAGSSWFMADKQGHYAYNM